MKIEREKLKDLLVDKRSSIGWQGEGIGEMITGIVFIFSILCSDFKDIGAISGDKIELIAWIVAAGIVIYGGYRLIRGLIHRYSYKKLLEDIDKMDEIQKSYSLVAIKDTFSTCPGRFLVYYDPQWGCWFFPNVKTHDEKNLDRVREWISNQIHADMVDVTEEAQDIYTKKHPNGESRTYHHTLYEAKVKEFPDQLKNNEFKLNDLDYKWMTIAEMEKDPVIMEQNRDVVHLVKDNIR